VWCAQLAGCSPTVEETAPRCTSLHPKQRHRREATLVRAHVARCPRVRTPALTCTPPQAHCLKRGCAWPAASRAPYVVRPSSKSTQEPPSIIICTSSSRSSCEYPLAATFFQKSRNSTHVMVPFPSSSTSAKPGCRGVVARAQMESAARALMGGATRRGQRQRGSRARHTVEHRLRIQFGKVLAPELFSLLLGNLAVAVQIHLVEKRLELRLQDVGKRALALGEGVRQPCLVNLLSTAAADDDRLGRERRPLHGTLLHGAVEGDPSATLGLAHLLALLEKDLCNVPERVLRARERQSDGDRASKRRIGTLRAEQECFTRLACVAAALVAISP